HAFNRPRLIRLPRCEKNFESPQKRLGGRLGLVVDLEVGSAGLIAATTHLDVVNAPRCRQEQLGALLAYLDSDSCHQAVVGGDFNTHTFSRGTSLGEARSLARLLVNPDAVVKNLLSPFGFEPALKDLERFGFDLRGFNDQLETCRVGDSELLQSSALPGPLKELVRRRFGSRARSLDFRLDWLAGRGVKPLADGGMVDIATGVFSISAQTLPGLEYQGCPISDHNPIVADIIAAPSQ